MRPENIVIIGKREYLQRAKTKAFWITTLILPLFVSGISIVPTLLLSKSKANQRIVVVDETGRVGADLLAKLSAHEEPKAERPGGMRMATFEAKAEPPAGDRAAQRTDLDRRVMDKQIDAWVWIGPEVFQDKPVEYHARSVSNVLTQDALKDDI